MKITFLGGGNMASALIGGLLNNGFPTKEIAVIEIGAENRARLEKNLRVRCYAGPDAEALQCDALVLAVKPQQMREACAPLQKFLKEQLVMSIAAGLRLTDLSRWLGGYNKLIRTMPNTPALISSGVTGMFAMPTVSEAVHQRQLRARLAQPLPDLAADYGAAERHIAARDALRKCQEVRPDVVAIAAEPAPRAPKARYDLVCDQQHVVA